MTALIKFDSKMFYEYFISRKIYELYAPKTSTNSNNMYYKFLPDFIIETTWGDGVYVRALKVDDFNERNDFGSDRIERDSPLAQKLIKDHPLLVLYMSL